MVLLTVLKAGRTYFLTPPLPNQYLGFTSYQLGCHSRRSSRHCCPASDCLPPCCCAPRGCPAQELAAPGAGALPLRGALASLLRTAPSSRSRLGWDSCD